MPDLWTWLIATTLPAVLFELLVLCRVRRVWVSGAAPMVLAERGKDRPARQAESDASRIAEAHEGWLLETPHVESAGLHIAEAILCFDPSGQCTSANPAGRRLLPLVQGASRLSDLLSGGAPGAASFLASVAAEGVVERDEALVTEPAFARMHVKALALRDRDSNFWGAALFIRPEPGTSHSN